MINTKLQSIIDTKSAIGNAITNKGGTITANTPFFNYAAEIDGISTGTPQTIFAASDGSKWALTNVVNLTNVSNNVTYDFNRWQPANNATSDPILNVGTVNGNISGNIRIVQVNQVNIAQYVNIVINDTTGAKYVGYNGYDSQTNPTPTGNTTFNRWLLNNSASGTVLFANTTIVNGGTFNGTNTATNLANMSFVGNATGQEGVNSVLVINNGHFFVGGEGSDPKITKFNESNLAVIANSRSFRQGTGSPSTFTPIRDLAVNNGFVYGVGLDFFNSSTFLRQGRIQKFHESNLVFSSNSANYGEIIRTIAINNSFVYIGGLLGIARKYHESNLVFSANTGTYGTDIEALATNNSYLYVGGENSSGSKVSKYHESNLAFVNSTNNYGGRITTIAINNGFIYVGGFQQTLQKFNEDNLSFVGNTADYGGIIRSITTNNGFVYVGGDTNRQIKKYYESNLAFVGNTFTFGGHIFSIGINNTFIYASGGETVTRKINEFSEGFEQLPFYTATKIKE